MKGVAPRLARRRTVRPASPPAPAFATWVGIPAPLSSSGVAGKGAASAGKAAGPTTSVHQDTQEAPGIGNLGGALDEAEERRAGVIPQDAGCPSPQPSSRRPARFALALSLSLLVALVAFSCVLFVWPTADRPEHVDGVLSLNGPNEDLREARALALVRGGYAPVLLFSQGHYALEPCPKVPHVTVVCFLPKPARTVGEITFAVRYAARHNWHSIMVVAARTQATRARLLMARCFKGHAVIVPAARPPVIDLLPQVAYEWGALVKALVIDPGC